MRDIVLNKISGVLMYKLFIVDGKENTTTTFYDPTMEGSGFNLWKEGISFKRGFALLKTVHDNHSETATFIKRRFFRPIKKINLSWVDSAPSLQKNYFIHREPREGI